MSSQMEDIDVDEQLNALVEVTGFAGFGEPCTVRGPGLRVGGTPSTILQCTNDMHGCIHMSCSDLKGIHRGHAALVMMIVNLMQELAPDDEASDVPAQVGVKLYRPGFRDEPCRFFLTCSAIQRVARPQACLVCCFDCRKLSQRLTTKGLALPAMEQESLSPIRLARLSPSSPARKLLARRKNPQHQR